MRSVYGAQGVLQDTWMTTLQKSTSIFHHAAALFGVSQYEGKLQSFRHQVLFVRVKSTMSETDETY